MHFYEINVLFQHRVSHKQKSNLPCNFPLQGFLYCFFCFISRCNLL
nr:MAG TPA: hypothetical protein [Caudoviricetes sp.]